jgi:hypothetical protein
MPVKMAETNRKHKISTANYVNVIENFFNKQNRSYSEMEIAKQVFVIPKKNC